MDQSTMSPHLPPEIYDRILDFLHDDPKALAACSLTCRTWLPTTRYHRLRTTTIAWPYCSSFHQLLTASSGLGRFITTLEICNAHPSSTGWQGDRETFAFFEHLPVVKDLKLSRLVVREPLHISLSKCFCAIKRLTLCRCIYTADLQGLLGSLSLLEELCLDHVRYADSANSNTVPPGSLRTLRIFELVGDSKSLIEWSLSAQDSRLDTLEFRIREPEDAAQLDLILQLVGPSIKHLTVSISAWWDLDTILAGLSFAPCVSLRSFALHFMSLQMCVRGNKSLLWAITLLGQLSSSQLDKITLGIMVDNMIDLRALDSECAVRALSPARFMDLRALDWEEMDMIVMQPQLERLGMLEIEGEGDAQLLDVYVRERCPELHSRQILNFKRVQLKDSLEI